PHSSPRVLLLIAAVPVCLLAQAPHGTPTPVARTDVPVKSVVLYSSGVGYFEHAGTVRGAGPTETRLETDPRKHGLTPPRRQAQDARQGRSRHLSRAERSLGSDHSFRGPPERARALARRPEARR